MRVWILVLAVLLVAGCNAPAQEQSDGGDDANMSAPPVASSNGACTPLGSWEDPATYEALANKSGVAESATDDLMVSAPGDPGARVTWFGVRHESGIAFHFESNATVVWLLGEVPEGASEDEVRAELGAFLRRMTPADDAQVDAWVETFLSEDRVRIDAPLKIEEVWQSLGAPEPGANNVTWRLEEGVTWEARWARATRTWSVDTEEQPLTIVADAGGQVTAYSNGAVPEEEAQPWLAKTFAQNELPLPEFTGWQGAGDGTHPAC